MTAGSEREEKSFDRSIVEGPIGRAVWMLAWPTMLQNILGGMQGLVDHIMVGHYVGFEGNAAIGVAWQIFLVVIVFIMSLFTGMGILVARFAGADDSERVNRAVYQAFLTAVILAVGVLAPLGYFLSPTLLSLVNATDAVRAEALPYLRTMFVYSVGMMIFFMLGGALRSAGDARTPLNYGIALTILNILLNIVFIRGLGPIPAYGTQGAAMGTVIAGGVLAIVALRQLFAGVWVVGFKKLTSWAPDWKIITSLFRFGIPTGIQGVAMNAAGVIMLRFVGSLAQSAEAQAAYSIGYVQLFSLITWTSVGLLGAAAAVGGQNLGAGKPERTVRAVHVGSGIGIAVAAAVGILFIAIPDALFAVFGMQDPVVIDLGVQLLLFLTVSGFFITVALVYTGGLQGTGDTRGPLYISIVSQIIVPLGLLTVLQATGELEPIEIWSAIVLGHVLRCVLSIVRFRTGKWRHIKVEMAPKGS